MGDFDNNGFKGCRTLFKKRLRLLTGVLTGHYTLEHLHRPGIVDEVFCRFCGAEVETSQHLLMNCGVISVQGVSIFSRHEAIFKDFPGPSSLSSS